MFLNSEWKRECITLPQILEKKKVNIKRFRTEGHLRERYQRQQGDGDGQGQVGSDAFRISRCFSTAE